MNPGWTPCASAKRLRVVHGEPSLGAQADRDVLFARGARGGQVAVAELLAEVAVRQHAPASLEVAALDGLDRALDRHVLVRRALGLNAQTDAIDQQQELPL